MPEWITAIRDFLLKHEERNQTVINVKVPRNGHTGRHTVITLVSSGPSAAEQVPNQAADGTLSGR